MERFLPQSSISSLVCVACGWLWLGQVVLVEDMRMIRLGTYVLKVELTGFTDGMYVKRRVKDSFFPFFFFKV